MLRLATHVALFEAFAQVLEGASPRRAVNKRAPESASTQMRKRTQGSGRGAPSHLRKGTFRQGGFWQQVLGTQSRLGTVVRSPNITRTTDGSNSKCTRPLPQAYEVALV